MRFCISCGLNNLRRAELLSGVLERRGHEHSLDRMSRSASAQGEVKLGERTFAELRAVRDAELMLVLLPAMYDTHIELGVAYATRGNKRIILWSETGEEFDVNDPACSFYFYPSAERVVCPFEDLVAALDREQIGTELI